MEIYTATQIIIRHQNWLRDHRNLPKVNQDKLKEAKELLQKLMTSVENNVI